MTQPFPSALTRRSALGLATASASALTLGVPDAAAAAAGHGPDAGHGSAGDAGHGSAGDAGHGSAGDAVRVLVDGVPAVTGTLAFPAAASRIVLDNGLIQVTFTADDASAGIVTGWADVSVTASSVVVDGTELARNLNGVDPRDPDRQHSFYVDAAGGRTRLVATEVRIPRLGPDLAEVVFADTTSGTLRHEHHVVMRRGRRGLYGYVVTTAVTAQSISEIRMNTRWDRSILDHAFTWERGGGQQPTYAYLATQTRVGDETWQVDGVSNPALPSPDSNSGNLPAGSVYTKYNWSAYHHENPMFGHYGNGFGVWFTSLGGVTDGTLCATYGSGPQHQDLAVHQDALILNYFSPNHYGQIAYALPAGYQRLYGPWYTFVTTGDPDHPETAVAEAARVAQAEIEEHRGGAAWVSDPLYPSPPERTTVTGRLTFADGRPAAGCWVVLCVQDADDVFTLHEPTYFVRTRADGGFSLPGIPPAWLPGTRDPGTYVLYAFAAGGPAAGAVTSQFKRTGISVSGRRCDLGDLVWSPPRYSTVLWQIGGADRTGGEFALATDPVRRLSPRSYEKAAAVPATLTFTVGSSWEPADWYFAQTRAGVWTIAFTLDRLYTGTAYLTVSSSMQQGNAPVVAVNGSSSGITGALPAASDSTIGRQADRSGRPRLAVLSFPAARLVPGENTITLTRGGSGGGMGWDTVLLEADEATPPAPARLAVQMARDPAGWAVTVTNTGAGAAHDVRLRVTADCVPPRADPTAPQAPATSGYAVNGQDPARFPVPVAGILAAGASATVLLTVGVPVGVPVAVGSAGHERPVVTVSSDGGRCTA